ncbi:site-specific DNA-methyltransferase [Dermacoccus nishinomiyaensis]|uniref:site-specific DNA-methyltransferase n=1 Tax=Dermacoccus nishinomiyaensis TaxID=1274 RepID=UPI0010AC8E4D|nr:DNA methyltransferase [Dermacoccus nishinomiyaensis]TJZ94733.1 site-specific DNA-methyltransferase [Dermacoccus nishinomiyaensis]
MSRLTELLRQARKADPQLGADLEAEIAALTKRRTFGLVFEQHQPEAVELPGRPVRRGDKVRVLPPRGETKGGDQRLWRVTRIERVDGQRVAHLAELDAEEPETQAVVADDVVVVAEFRDRIYPGLVETGRVERGGDKPFHTVINAENYHALEMLTYTHRHSIDAIYIDPPYNTGAKDWKYNNDYVASDDDYRHSKWLAFMERRLKIARELLNPEDSVLIVTIDEKEYLRLGLLLEQTFPEARIQMVAAQIAPQGNPRNRQFYRTDEYIFFVGLGNATPLALALDDAWRSGTGDAPKKNINWPSLLRTGSERRREDRPSMFYPIFVEQAEEGARIHSFGSPHHGDDFALLRPPPGAVAVWPIGRDGELRRWQVSADSAERLRAEGFLRAGKWNGDRTAIQYLARTSREEILSGKIATEGRNWDGSFAVSGDHRPTFIPGTLWKIPSHDATRYGTQIIPKLLPGRKFPFPKSLYAVEDALRFFVKGKSEAVVLDFFSGSGTTAHAVMRLNRQDGGRRQCISVTNNEVSADEQAGLRQKGLRPGDSDWEALGICDYITKPRLTAAISGQTPEGAPIKGDYKFTDEFPMSEGFEQNASFFTLTYEAPLSVRHNRAFERVAPMLWLRAGSRGRIIYDLGEDGWDVAEAYGVLENLDQADEFVAAVSTREGIEIAYVVTDDDSAFQMVCRELPNGVLPVRLYESYLQNFEINTGRSL